MAELVRLDGGAGEGGGQIVRTALALSALTGKPFIIENIRKGRPVPGLKAQHMHAIKIMEKMCGGTSEGAAVGSETLKFFPGKLSSGNFGIDVGTAGSLTLILQSAILPSLFCPSKVSFRLSGGTDVAWSMPVDYFAKVFLPHIAKYAEVSFKLEKRGYYPAGGGRIALKIVQKYSGERWKEAPRFRLDSQGGIMAVRGISHASSDLEASKAAEIQADTARKNLPMLKCPLDISSEYCGAESSGSGITLWASFSKDGVSLDSMNPVILGVDALCGKKISPESAGKRAAQALLLEMNSGAAVDEHLADNLIPFLAVFGGVMKVSRISDHTRTNVLVTEAFLGEVFDFNEGSRMISVKNPAIDKLIDQVSGK